MRGHLQDLALLPLPLQVPPVLLHGLLAAGVSGNTPAIALRGPRSDSALALVRCAAAAAAAAVVQTLRVAVAAPVVCNTLAIVQHAGQSNYVPFLVACAAPQAAAVAAAAGGIQACRTFETGGDESRK